MPKRRVRTLARADDLENRSESRQILDVECGGDIEITRLQHDTVQLGRCGARDYVVDAGFVEESVQCGDVGRFACYVVRSHA
jgi:hypothetical protein